MIRMMKINSRGLTLVEMMVVLVIFSFISLGIYAIFSTGQSTWFNTDTAIELQQTLRIVLEKVTREMHESGYDKSGVAQLNVFDGTGVNGTDVIRFSIPVLCQTGMSVLDVNGDVAHWRAPLTWGCTDSSCMDADNDCSTVDYKYIRYLITATGDLVRQVLGNNGALIREDPFAHNILNLQVTIDAGGNLVTLQITAQKRSLLNKLITASVTMDVYLRNRGNV